MSHWHDPSPPSVPEDQRTITRNMRYGLWLFALYAAIYAVFLVLNAFHPDAMDATIFGINLAIVYGLGLIVLAFVLALWYAWLCRPRREERP